MVLSTRVVGPSARSQRKEVIGVGFFWFMDAAFDRGATIVCAQFGVVINVAPAINADTVRVLGIDSHCR